MRFTMKHCSNLFYLSTIACKLNECLTEEELTALSTDLVLLGDLIANLIAHNNLCNINHNAKNDNDCDE